MAVYVRARDLRSNIKEMGYEKGMVHTVELLLEELSAIRLTQREITEMMSAVINHFGQLTMVTDRMKEKVEAFENSMRPQEEEE